MKRKYISMLTKEEKEGCIFLYTEKGYNVAKVCEHYNLEYNQTIINWFSKQKKKKILSAIPPVRVLSELDRSNLTTLLAEYRVFAESCGSIKQYKEMKKRLDLLAEVLRRIYPDLKIPPLE